jgi:hypothetical protein
MNILKTKKMKKLYLTVTKEWLLKNYPKMTIKEMCNNKIIQDKPFIEQTGKLIKK